MGNDPDARSQARLLAATSKESGAWLNVLPVSSLGLRMDDESIRVGVGLRLGVPLCQPHLCHQCGAEVDHLATHGHSCRRSLGHHSRHATLNDIIHRALSSFLQQHPYFLFIKKNVFCSCSSTFCNYILCIKKNFTQYEHTYGQLRASHGSHMMAAHTVLYMKKHTQTYASYPAMDISCMSVV